MTSAKEILASLNLFVDADHATKLDKHLAAAYKVSEPDRATVLALLGAGYEIHATFYPGASHGSGLAHVGGGGSYTSSKQVPPLSGKYKLEVGRGSAELYRGGDLVWSGVGGEDGLSGTYNIKF